MQYLFANDMLATHTVAVKLQASARTNALGAQIQLETQLPFIKIASISQFI